MSKKNLENFFEPISVAVIGASHTPEKLGYIILENFVRENFSGYVFPVNPDTTPILGKEVYSSVKKIPEKVDLAIVIVPALAVAKVVKECIEKKIPSVIVISGGFSEIGGSGIVLEQRLKKTVDGAKGKTRVVGPNCVIGKTFILVRKGNPSLIEFKEIGEIVENLFKKYKNYVTDFGDTRKLSLSVVKPFDKIQVLSWDNNKISFKNVVNVFKRKAQRIIKVKIEGGKRIFCTEDHPFLVKQNDKILKVSAKDLDVGDLIPCSFKISGSNSISEINFSKEILELPKNLKNKIKISYNSKIFDIDSFDFASSDLSKSYLIWSKRHRVKIPIKMTLTKEFLMLLGTYIADGSYKPNQLSIGYIKDKSMEEKLRICAKLAFISSYSKNRKKNSKSKEIKFGGNIGKILFKNIIKIGDSAFHKKIPDFVFNLSKELQIAFLSGLISGDGGISGKNFYYYTISEKLANQLQYLFNILGIGPVYLKESTRDRMQIKGKKVKTIKKLYEIRSDSLQFIMDLNNLGFSFLSEEKNVRMKGILDSGQRSFKKTKGAVYFRKVKKIMRMRKLLPTYDFEVEDTHNLVLNHIITSNCIGVFVPKTKVDTMFLSRERLRRPKEGNIAFISQSGAVGSTVLDWLAKEGIGISKFVSYGNAVDLNETDFLEFLADDKDTRVIAMYLEGMKADGKKFLTTLKNTTRKKPVVVLKAGKTEKGTKAVTSHTGSLAGSARIYSAAFRQTGVIEAATWEELFDFSKALSMQPLPKNNRLIIITDGGGFGVLATDEAERQSIQLLEPTEKLKKKLKTKMPSHVILHNPIDLTGDADAERYRNALEETLGSNEYDGAVVISLMQVPTLDTKISEVIEEMKKFGKSILACAVGSDFTERVAKSLENKGIPVFPTPERAVRAFSALWNYKKFSGK